MFFTAKTEKRQSNIDIREAYNLWDLLNSKYLMAEVLNNYDNQIKDGDFKLFVKILQKSLHDNISQLEKLMGDYAIKSPDRNRKANTFPAGSQLITDEFIAMDIFIYMQKHVENLAKVLRSTVTNDSIRTAIKTMTFKTINQVDKIICYLTAKGWISTPPMYKHLPEDIKERISVAEASNLWDHLTQRYDNAKTTEIFMGVVHDIDFKIILSMGLKTLNRQIEILEKELERFGIPFPKQTDRGTFLLSGQRACLLTPNTLASCLILVVSFSYIFRIALSCHTDGRAIMHPTVILLIGTPTSSFSSINR